MIKYFEAFLIPLFLFQQQTKAQTTDSILNKMANEYATEKVFIHFDKLAYNKTETIWFKAYIMDGNLPSLQSKNFYADWYNDKGDLLRHDAYPIFQSTAKGQFEIPVTYTGSSIHVKAYTKWMLNSDSVFFFNKYISIIQPTNQKQQLNTIKSVLQFFPEGGDIINGIGSFVAFKATNQYGQPLNIFGVVKNNIGEIIDSIKTDHDGMGNIFIAEPNLQQQYTAYYKDEFTDIEHTKLLPSIVANGVGMQVQNLGKVTIVNIKRSEDVSDDKKFLKLYALMNGQIVYKASLKLLKKNAYSLSIPTDSLPTGIMQLTLFNDNFLPLAERIVFIKNDNYNFTPSVNIVTKNISKRGKNIIEIKVPDSLISNMSVAITDANIATDSSTNIYTQLLLCGDIKGNVNNPAYYFLSNADSTLQHLDLVMLTNGWRKYNWQTVANGKMPYIRYQKDSSYLQIAGKTFGVDKNDLLQKPDIFVFLQSKDSSKKQFILPVKKDGSFGKSNFIFYDTLKIYYTFLGNNKLNRSAEVAFQNGLFSTPSKNNLDTIISKCATINTDFFDRQRKLDEAYKRLVNIKGSGFLNEVTVKTRAKSANNILDDKYASGLFNGGDAYQFDLLNDNRAASALSIFTYLQGVVPGLQISQQDGQTVVKWRQSSTSFFLDEIQSDVETVESISMNDIAYIKVFRPPFFGGSGGSPGGAIAIYTRKGADVKSTPGKGIPFKFLEGYASHKEFFSPNYEKQNDLSIPDIRTTLYWNPYIITDAINKKAIIEFYNNDVSKKLRIILCGMNTEGKLTWIEKILE